MEPTACGSISLHLSATAAYLMLMHCESTSCFCEQDALCSRLVCLCVMLSPRSQTRLLQ